MSLDSEPSARTVKRSLILSLDHVQLAMPAGREDEARKFYTEILGMTELTKPPVLAARGGCWFQAGNAIIHLGVEEPFSPARKAHPALVVLDLDRMVEVLRADGAPVIDDNSLPNVRRFYTADPFGNRIEFMSEMKPASGG